MNTQWIGRALHRFRAGSRYSAWNHPALIRVPEVIHVRSEWFNEGGAIPFRAAGKGVGDNVSPPFTWDGVPAGTIELALLMEDLDAPLPRPFVHLIAYGIPGHFNGVPEGAFGPSGGAFRFGRNTNGSHGYMGPRPIRGHGPHSYAIQIVALNRAPCVGSRPNLKSFLNCVFATAIGRGRLIGVFTRE